MGWFGLQIRAQREKPSLLIGLKLKNSKIRKNGPSRAPGPPGLVQGWPHTPPLGPMGPHGSFMVAPWFNDEAAKSRYGAHWVAWGSPRGRAHGPPQKKVCAGPFGAGPPRAPPPLERPRGSNLPPGRPRVLPPLPSQPRAPFHSASLRSRYARLRTNSPHAAGRRIYFLTFRFIYLMK